VHAFAIGTDIRYGLGTAIYEDGPYGHAYGHGGWIPCYCSSLRYYPQHKVVIAFQINTDISVMNGEQSILHQVEQQLAGVIMTDYGSASKSPDKLRN
jgi:hypothetical protein